MAPVGRWQQNRDLSWYAKGDGDDPSAEETARQEEFRRVKEAEQEAMARALGLPVAPKDANANLTPLGGKEVAKAIKESAEDNVDDDVKIEGGRGIGYGGFGGKPSAGDQIDKMEAVGLVRDSDRGGRSSRRHREEGQRSRGRSRDRERSLEKKSRRRDHDSFRNERRHGSRSRDRRREGRDRSRDKEREHRRRRSTSGTRNRDRERRHRRHRHHSRSRSPSGHKDSRQERRRYDERR